MNDRASQPAGIIRCPRCGYDQRGVMSTWDDSCPLNGVCAECGVKIFWPEVCNPAKFEPRWCVEFVYSLLQFPRACLSTYRRSLQPWSFWQRMRMAFEVHPGRLIAYALAILIVPPMLLHVPIQTALAIRARQVVSQNLATAPVTPPAAHVSYLSTPIENQGADAIVDRIDDLQKQITQVDTQFNRLKDVSREQVVNAIQQEIQRLREVLAEQYPEYCPPAPPSSAPSPTLKPPIDGSLSLAIFEAIMFPESNSSLCTIKLGTDHYDAYPAPAKLRFMAVSSWAGTNPWQFIRFTESLALMACWILWLLFPLSFILLPASRRKAKVQWRHIFRIAMYGLVLISLLQILAMLEWNLMWITQTGILRWLWEYMVVMFWIALPVYWCVAIEHHLKMPHAKSISVLLTLMIALLSMPLLQHVLPLSWVSLLLGT